jgi:autotransporter translocation and assembly factor TamB
MKKALRIPAYIFAVFLLIVVAVVYLYMFTTLPEREINNWLDYRALKAAGYNLSFERLNRDLWNHLIIEGIDVTPEEGKPGPSIRLNRVKFRYDFVGLMKGEYILSSVEIDSIGVEFPFGAGGPKTGAGEKRISLPFSVSAEEFHVGSVSLILPNGETIFFDSADFSVSMDDGGIESEIRNLNVRWPDRDFEIIRLAGRIKSVSDGFRLDRIHLVTGNSDLYLGGTVGSSFTGDLDLSIGCEPINLVDIKNLTGSKISGELNASLTFRGGIKDFHGEALVDGVFLDRPFENVGFSYGFRERVLRFESIDGRIFHADFKGSGEIDFGVWPERYVYAGDVSHLNLQDVSPDLKTDFSGSVNLEGQAFGGENFGMRIASRLDSVRIEDYFFDEVSGTVAFDLEKIDFLSDFNARYRNTFLKAEGRLEYSGLIDIKGEAGFRDLGDFTGQIFLKELGGRGNALFHLTGPTVDFNIDATFESDSCWTYGLEPGMIRIDASLRSFIDHRVGTVNGAWEGGGLYTVPTDSGFFETSVSGEMVFFDTVGIYGLDGGVRMKGIYDGSQVPPVFTADTLHGEIYGNSFASPEPVEIRVFDSETEIEDLKIRYENGIIALKGIVTNDLEMGLEFTISDFQMRPILNQIYPRRDVRGIWSGSASLAGNFDEPIIEFQMEMDSLFIDRHYLGRLDARMYYADGYLRTDSAKLAADYGEYRFSGRFPIDLSFGEIDNRFPDNPIDFRLETSGERFLLAEAFIDAIDRFDTEFEFDIELTGTYSQPEVTGRGNLTKGVLKIQYMVNPLVDLEGRLRMKDNKVFVDSAWAAVAGQEREWGGILDLLKSDNAGKKAAKNNSSVRTYGTLTLLDLNNFLYDLEVRGRNAYFLADAYNVSGIADFDLNVEGETPPVVRGDITLSRLDIRDNYESFVGYDYDPSVAAVEDSTIWDLDLNLKALNNIWVKNRDINAEFKADMRVQRHVGILGSLGGLEAIRGTYNVLGEEPRIQSGTITYPDFATVDPEIDFVVIKRIPPRTTDGGESISEPITMEIHVTGTLLVPKIEVPGFSQEEALRLLVSGSWAGRTLASERKSQDYLNSVTAVAASMGLDPSTVQTIFEELEIGEFEADKGPRLSVAKYISPNLYVRYSRRLRDPESSIGVEYYLNDHISFRATQGMKGSEHEGISFDLNLNYEY